MSDRPGETLVPFWHVRKADVHAGSARDVDPPFESFDVVMRRDYEVLDQQLEEAQNAARGAALESDERGEKWMLAKERYERAENALGMILTIAEDANRHHHRFDIAIAARAALADVQIEETT